MKKGFTLTEIMIVITVMGILAAISAPVFINVTTRARFKEVKAITDLVATAASYYDGKYDITNLLTNEPAEAQRWDELSLDPPQNATCNYFIRSSGGQVHLIVEHGGSQLYRYNCETRVGIISGTHSHRSWILNIGLP